MQELWMTMRARRPTVRRTARPTVLVCTAVAAILMTGCRIDVGTDVAFDTGGGGEIAVSVRIDGATLRDLDRVGADPELDVALGLGTASGWNGERSVDADGGLVLTYRQAFTDGASATALLRELSADVAVQDPAIRLDVTVVTGTDGSVRLTGMGSISPPETLGVSLDDEPVGPVGAELAAMTADAVRATLTVRVPGTVIEHDADGVDGSTLRWALPVGEPRPLTLVADAAPVWRRIPWWAVLGVVAATSAGTTLASRRRRAPVDDTPDTPDAPDAGGVSPAG